MDFTKFISYVLSDANKMLEVALVRLREMNGQGIEGTRDAEGSSAVGSEQNPEERTDDEDGEWGGTTGVERLRGLESSALFAQEVLSFVALLCGEIPEALLQGLVTDQVASMLDYFLLHLAGPRMREIQRVPEYVMKQAGFQHRQLVEQLVHCFVGLARSPCRETFAEAICADVRSYSPEGFDQILSFLRAKAVLSDRLPELESFFAYVRTVHGNRQDQEALWGDPPERFMCQITYAVLLHPVALPEMPEDVVVERDAIYRHLLFDEHNPFNRQPLTPAELTDFNARDEVREKCERLKHEIEEWKGERLREGPRK